MIPDSLKQDIDRWLDGDLALEEGPRLREELESTPNALEFFGERALLHQMLAISRSPLTNFKNEPTGFDSIAHPRREVSTRSNPGAYRAWVLASFVVAASLLFASFLFLPTATASPSVLVQKTLSEYQPSLDRCYSVKVDAGKRLMRNGFRGRFLPLDSKLWVRGDSFVQLFDHQGEQLVWGRDSGGSLWFSISGSSAVVFDADEMPPIFQELFDLRSLHLGKLLESLLLDYELQYSSRDGKTSTIFARPLPGMMLSKFGAVEIEIEPDTLLVCRVTLERLKEGRPVAVVNFVLEEVRSREDSLYELKTHLQPDGRILDRTARLGRRVELLREFQQRLRFPLEDRK